MICPRGNKYKENNRGPRTEPCGTPQDSEEMSDTNSPTETVKLLFLRYDENHSNAVPDMPTQLRSLSIKMLWSTAVVPNHGPRPSTGPWGISYRAAKKE